MVYLLVFAGSLCGSFAIFVRYLTSGRLGNQSGFGLVIVRLEGLQGKPVDGLIFIKGARHSTYVLLPASNYLRSRNSSHPALNVVIAATVVRAVHPSTEDTSFIKLNNLIRVDFFACLIVCIDALAVLVAAGV